MTNAPSEPSTESLQLAAQCWCDEETGHIEMDVNLATAFAKRLDALQSQLQEAQAERDEEAKSALESISLDTDKIAIANDIEIEGENK